MCTGCTQRGCTGAKELSITHWSETGLVRVLKMASGRMNLNCGFEGQFFALRIDEH